MKKIVSVLAVTSLLLTGCGAAAGTAESSSSAANAASPKDSASVAESNSEPEKNEPASDRNYYDWIGYDIPIPGGMQRNSEARKVSLTMYTGGTEDDPVYFAIDNVYDEDYRNQTEGRQLSDLPDAVWGTMNKYIALNYKSYEDSTKKTVESQTETKFMDFPALCERGTFTLADGQKINFVSYYTYADFPEEGSTQVPSFWFAFTPSDDQKAIEMMNQAADDVLTDSKLNALVANN